LVIEFIFEKSDLRAFHGSKVSVLRGGVQGLRVPLMRLCRALGWRWRWGLAVGVVRMLVSVVVVMMLDVLAVMMSVRRMVMDAVVVSGCLRLGFG
jgi:hypothetical protein